MPMPTTRRGRFLYYRARAQRRQRETRETRPSAAFALGGVGGSKATCRQRDRTGQTLQVSRTYPRRPVVMELDNQTGWLVPPRYAQWGVPLWPVPLMIGLGPKTRPERAFLFYAKRRVHWLPTLRQLPWRPWRHAIGDLTPGQFYPFAFYPSGRPGYAASQGWV